MGIKRAIRSDNVCQTVGTLYLLGVSLEYLVVCARYQETTNFDMKLMSVWFFRVMASFPLNTKSSLTKIPVLSPSSKMRRYCFWGLKGLRGMLPKIQPYLRNALPMFYLPVTVPDEGFHESV
ncbi:MAG: hypothetical protein JRJ77_06225 [Deltaproteobacteria bacterium]|nr:hypothetical protein [Deltaproteobacteria bacterium]MBW2340175.1 hypothetical protein [Deltaproteobacteria bacterium]